MWRTLGLPGGTLTSPWNEPLSAYRGGGDGRLAGFGEHPRDEVVEDRVGRFAQRRLQRQQVFEVALGPGDRQTRWDAVFAFSVEHDHRPLPAVQPAGRAE